MYEYQDSNAKQVIITSFTSTSGQPIVQQLGQQIDFLVPTCKPPSACCEVMSTEMVINTLTDQAMNATRFQLVP